MSLTDAELRKLFDARNPFDWKRPDNIDAHPLRYSPIRDAVEAIISTRLFWGKIDGHLLEMSLQIAEVFEVARTSTHPSNGEIREAALEDALKHLDAKNSCCHGMNCQRGEQDMDDSCFKHFAISAIERALKSSPAPSNGDGLTLADWEKLRDPTTLHVNLLRGFPCSLSRAQLLHLVGTDPDAPNSNGVVTDVMLSKAYEAEQGKCVPDLQSEGERWNGEVVRYSFAGLRYPSLEEAKKAQNLARLKLILQAALSPEKKT